MGLKKILLSLTAIVVFIVSITVQGMSHAATVQQGKEVWMGIIERIEPNIGYSIDDPSKGARIWKILKYNSETSNTYDDKTNFYCVKSGIGFTSYDQQGLKRRAYDAFYDMKTEREKIKTHKNKNGEQNEVLKSLVEGTITENGKTISRYNAILAAFDSLYLPGESTEEEKKELIYTILKCAYEDDYYKEYKGDPLDFMVKAFNLPNGQDIGNFLRENSPTQYELTDYALTDNDINAVQQAVLWYFTNYGEENGKYDKTLDSSTKSGWLYYTSDGTNYRGLQNYEQGTKIGLTRSYQAEILYNYMIKQAKENADKYSADSIESVKSNTTMKLWTSSTNNQEQPLVEVHRPKKIEKEFDLALRKYITKVEHDNKEVSIATRVPNITESTLTSGTTATYKHRKDPVTVATGDKVTYKMTIYNEGQKAGRATKVVDQLPTGLKFSKIVSGNFELGSYNETTNTLNLVRKAENQTNLPAYTTGNLTSGTGSETIEIECTVTATPDTNNNKILTNVAWISEEIDEDGTIITTEVGKDRDSEPANKPNVNKDNMSNYSGKDNKTDLADSNYYYKGQQDDDDFEKLVLLSETFDLKLIKRITQVNDQNVPERIKSVDVSKLNTSNTDSKTTADYQLNKEPVGVTKGDIVTYTFRIYNEGTIDGYAQEITEDVPEGLQFLWSEKEGEELNKDTTLTEEEKKAIEFNQKYLWGKFVYDDKKENITQISSDYLSKANETTTGGNLIKAFGHNDGTKTEKDLSYKELSVKFKVVSENVAGTVIRNEAAITEDSDKEGKPVDDRDSETDKWVKYEDDEDYDNIILQAFDLALRKFIIAVSADTKIENNEYLKNENGSYTRAPIVDTSKLNTLDETGKLITTAIYNHTKEPILVKQNDIVVYMLRVYNEGDIDGYASEIKDHLPPYLEFVEDEFNEKYGWKVSEDGRTVTTRYLESKDSLIAKAKTDDNGKIVLSYKEVPIMCKVSANAKPSENITNIADITEYLDKNKQPITDRDSQEDNVNLPKDKDLPSYKDKETGSYIPGQQDDDDFEKVIVKTFDLALRKWVTQAIVIENGKQTVTQTGHDAWDDPEAVVKVELHRKKLNQVTVKFRYSIRVYNQGEIEGYAKEVTDYIPQGLKFVASDNPGWKDEGNNVISTRALENTLLKPGEYADVQVLLTWANNENNMGVMNNTAEISEDYNRYGVPDKDSTPDNKKQGEDDIDDAPVMLSISTGQIRIYFTLGFIILITVASGVILIKRFVL